MRGCSGRPAGDRDVRGRSQPEQAQQQRAGTRRSTANRRLFAHDLPAVEEIVDDSFADALVAASETLEERSRRVLLARLAISTIDRPTLQQLGTELGLTRERVRQLELRAMERLLALPALGAARELADMARRAARSSEQLVLSSMGWLPNVSVAVSARTVLRFVGEDRPTAEKHARDLLEEFDLPSSPTVQLLERLRADVITRRIVTEYATWPQHPSLRQFPTSGAVRDVQGETRGSFESLKLGRLVAYESGLEEQLLRQLDVDDRVVRYQEQPLSIPVTMPEGEVTYTPDVLVQLVDGRTAIVEIKPLFHLPQRDVLLKAAGLATWAAKEGLGVFVGSGANRNLRDLLDFTVRPSVADGITELIEEGRGTWSAYRRLRGELDVSFSEFAAAIIQGGHIYETGPFRLRSATAREQQLLTPLAVFGSAA